MSDEIITCAGGAMDPGEAKRLSPVTLAFIGDAVFSLLSREHLLMSGVTRGGELHRRTVGYVRAGAQAAAAGQIEQTLSEDESEVFRRGRNASTAHVPKGTTMAVYHYATGLEALTGYLYLCGRHDRVREIFAQAARFLDGGEAAEP
jgi:ribonuclease-3 family protein